MAILPVGLSAEAGGYQIERSLRFNRADSTYLNRTASSPTDGKKATMSFWIKKCDLSTDTNESYRSIFYCGTPNVDGLRIAFARYGGYDNHEFDIGQNNGGSSAYFSLRTTQVFRDTSAYYHFVIRYDSTNATADDRVRIYVNGNQITSFLSRTNAPLNHIPVWQVSGTTLKIGKGRDDVNEHYDMYLSEFQFVDGQSLGPDSFGETNSDTGVWQPKKYSGSYGSNGYYLKFADNSGTTSTTLGKDSSGNSNNWTPNNFSVTAGAGNDSLVDSPTRYGTDTGVGGEVRGNYCTWNPLSKNSAQNLANGNLYRSSGSTWTSTLSTIAIPTSGKWYAEFVSDDYVYSFPGIQSVSAISSTSAQNVDFTIVQSGEYRYNGTNEASTGNISTGKVIGVAVDADTGVVKVYVNNVLDHTYSQTLVSGTTYFFSAIGSAGLTANFGQRPFAYTAPSGFAALCTTNLPASTILDGDQHFNAVLYTGNGTSQTIDTGLQPDFIWIKRRDGAAAHTLTDSVRGTSKQLFTNLTDAEQTDSDSGVTAISSSSMTLGDNNLAVGSVNGSGSTYVAWNWKANGAGVTNTAGTISSTVSANTTAGFSVVTANDLSGTSPVTIGHGLGVAPKFVIGKIRDASSNWYVYHGSLPASDYIILSATDAKATSSNIWDVAPTSSVITVGNPQNGWAGSATARDYVFYCFAPVAGFSAFGSYTGNGSTDGPFVFTGFRPRYVLIKRSSGVDNWFVYDTARGSYNLVSQTLQPNSSGAEDTTVNQIDILSNGFKCRSSNTATNQSSETYVYACFAENPFKFSLAR